MSFFSTTHNAIVSTGNSTNLSLASTESFTGTFDRVTNFAQLTALVILGVGESATLHLDLAIDNKGNNMFTRTILITESGQHTVLPVSRYFRVRLVADQGTSATGAIQILYHKTKSKPLTVNADDTITDNTDVEIVKAIMVGQDPSTGDYVNITSTTGGGTTGLTTSLESPLDAFGRLQVSNPLTLLATKQQTLDDPYQMVSLTTGSGATSYTAPFPHTDMTVGTAVGKVVRQSKLYNSYQPGKALTFFITGTLLDNSANDNVRARIGCFDDATDKVLDTNATGDGFFFQLEGSTTAPVLSIIHRTSNLETPGPISQVDTQVLQSAWNIDTLDGTGISGYNIDPTKRQIFVFSLAWLGVGDIICGVVNDNSFIPCHRFNFLNGETGIHDEVAFTTRGSLPVRYELEATGITTSPATMRQICASVSSDGGFTPEGIIYSVGTPIAGTTVSTVERPVLSLRLNQQAGVDIRPRVTLNILRSQLFNAAGNGEMVYKTYLFRTPGAFGATVSDFSPLLTGASFINAGTDTSLLDSAAEYDLSATAVDLTGTTYPYHRISWGFFSKDSSSIDATLQERIVTLNSDIAGNSDLLVITMESRSGNQQGATSFTWQEYE